MVIPAMDHIDKLLSTNSLDAKYKPSIHVALGITKETLNCYYNKTDSSKVYWITVGECLLKSTSVSPLLHWSKQYNTNWNILSRPIGNWLGLQLQRKLSGLNTTTCMPIEQFTLPRLSLHQLHQRSHQTYLMIYLPLLPPGQLSFVMILLGIWA